MNQREMSAFATVLRQSVQAALEAGVQLGSGAKPRLPQGIDLSGAMASTQAGLNTSTRTRKRKTRNGVTEPHSVGKLRQVWDICDQLKADGKEVDVESVRQLAAVHEIPASTAQIQFYAWRKFHARPSRMH